MKSTTLADFQYLPGKGIRGLVGNRDAVLGNAAYMEQLGIALGDLALQAEPAQVAGQTVVYVASEGRVLV